MAIVAAEDATWKGGREKQWIVKPSSLKTIEGGHLSVMYVTICSTSAAENIWTLKIIANSVSAQVLSWSQGKGKSNLVGGLSTACLSNRF